MVNTQSDSTHQGQKIIVESRAAIQLISWKYKVFHSKHSQFYITNFGKSENIVMAISRDLSSCFVWNIIIPYK